MTEELENFISDFHNLNARGIAFANAFVYDKAVSEDIAAEASCSAEPTYHSKVAPDTYYSSREAVLQRFYRPFTHARWTFAQMNGYFDLQEFTADAFCSPVRGTKNTDRAEHYKLHYHDFIIDPIANGWSDLHQCCITRMPGDEAFTIRTYSDGTAEYSESYYIYCARTTAEGGEGDWHTVEIPIKTSTNPDDKWNCFVIQSGSGAYPFKNFNQFCFHNMDWSGNAGNIYIDNVTLVK